MSLDTDVAPTEQYISPGGPIGYSVPFPFFDATDLIVLVTDLTGESTTLVLGTDYTVAGGGGSTGSITATVTAGYQITIDRQVPFTQGAKYPTNDPFPSQTHERALDKLTMLVQQVRAIARRALTFPVTVSPDVSAELPAPAADTFLGWNSSGDALTNKVVPGGTTVYAPIADTQDGISAAEAVTPDGLASLWQQGTDLATAATLVKPTSANLGGFYLMTGAINVSNGWAGEKAGRRLLFRVVAGGFNLVHGANWQNKTGANIATAANDTFEMVVESTGIWRMVAYHKADGTALAASVINPAGSNLFLWASF